MKNNILVKIVIIVIIFLGFGLRLLAAPIEQLYNNIDTDAITKSMRPNFVFTDGDSIRIIIGSISNKQIGYDKAGDGEFCVKLKAENDTFSVINYGKIFPPNDNVLGYILPPYQKENGNWVVINPNYYLIQGQMSALPVLCVIEFDSIGTPLYLNFDTTFAIPPEEGAKYRDHRKYGISLYTIGAPFILPNHNIVMINQYELSSTSEEHPIPEDTLAKYALIARYYDSTGNFMYMLPIKGIDMSRPDSIDYVLYYANYSSINDNDNGNFYFANIDDDGNFHFVLRSRYYKWRPDSLFSDMVYSIKTNLIVDADWNVISQTEYIEPFIPNYPEFDSLIVKSNVFLVKTHSYNPIVNESGENIFIQTCLIPSSWLQFGLENVHISIFNSDWSFKEHLKFWEPIYDDFSRLTITPKGDYLFAGRKQLDPYYNDPSFNPESSTDNCAAYILSKDFQTFKVYDPKIYSEIGFVSYRNDNFVTISPIIREDGRYEFWGVINDKVFSWILEDEDFINRPVKIFSGIDWFLSTDFNSKTYPNPTTATSTLSLDLEQAGILTITLNNLLGEELLELHNGFVDTGTYTQTFSIETLPIGVYYLKIIHNGNVKVEKVIRN